MKKFKIGDRVVTKNGKTGVIIEVENHNGVCYQVKFEKHRVGPHMSHTYSDWYHENENDLMPASDSKSSEENDETCGKCKWSRLVRGNDNLLECLYYPPKVDNRIKYRPEVESFDFCSKFTIRKNLERSA